MCVIAVADIIFNNERIVNSIWLTPECNYKLPDNVLIVFSKEKNSYAVKETLYGWYLSQGSHRIDNYSLTTKEPALFKDSCTAKAYAHKYINQFKPKITDL